MKVNEFTQGFDPDPVFVIRSDPFLLEWSDLDPVFKIVSDPDPV